MRLALRIDATKGWQRFALCCCYRLWQLAMMLCAMSLLVAMVTPIATLWMMGQCNNDAEMVKMLRLGLRVGTEFGLPGLIGMLALGSLEGTFWPTWWD